MRLTIDHSNEVADFTNSSRNYYIDCHVIFSEEEQAIVRERGLNHFSFATNNEKPEPTFPQAVVADIMRTVGPFMILTSFGMFFVSLFMGAGLGGIAWLVLFLGFIAWIFGLVRTRDILKYELERRVTVAHLIDNPKLRIWAKDPPWSRALEDQLRSDLALLKAKIMGSVELGKRESVEL